MSSSARAEKYLVAEQVGKGSFGSANVVINKETKEKYVLKKIRLARLSDWQRRSSFQELQLVSSLDHPFVVPFVEGWVDRGHTINIVYGYCRNGDLGSLLHSRKGHFTEDRLKTWLAQILLGLEYVHEAGVLHRDIKSSNLFLTGDYDIQIGDFGLATIRSGNSEPDYSVVGTPHYMSPELLSKQNYDFASDIWSLGCVMYELTALKPAFNAFNMHGLISKIRKASVAPLPSQYSADWCHLIRSMLKKTPSKRPTIQDLINAPCMREAITKAVKHGKNINKHFCYTELRSETPTYWKAQFVTYTSESSPGASEEPQETSEDCKRSPDTRKLSSSSSSKNRKSRRKRSSDAADTTKCTISEIPKPMAPISMSSSPREDSAAQDSVCKRDLRSPAKSRISRPAPKSETVEIEEEAANSDTLKQKSDSESSTMEIQEEEEIQDDCLRPQGPVPLENAGEQFDEEPCDMRPGCFVDHEDGDNETHAEVAYNECDEERVDSSPVESEPLSCKVDIVDVRKLDKDVEANDGYFPNTHWSNPSHMSAFIDGKRGDGLEAIPEGSCEENDSIMWNSLPAPGLAVYNICSPHEDLAQDFQRTLSGVIDPRASSSLRGDSPFAADPRMSPSVVSGSLNIIDNQKRLDALEQVLTVCSNLYSKGRWHELGHILTQMPKQVSQSHQQQGNETPEAQAVHLNVCTGDRVVVGISNPNHAIVRYYGPVAFGQGDWVGLELDTPVGKTDGNIGGIPYFSCPKDCGLFVKASAFGKNES